MSHVVLFFRHEDEAEFKRMEFPINVRIEELVKTLVNHLGYPQKDERGLLIPYTLVAYPAERGPQARQSVELLGNQTLADADIRAGSQVILRRGKPDTPPPPLTDQEKSSRVICVEDWIKRVVPE